jgi:hypothetical protein
MLNKNKTVRVIVEHQRTEKPDSLYQEYHEWVTTKIWVRANSKGIPNPKMMNADWIKVICNSPDCPALAYINVLQVIEQDFPIEKCLENYDSTH